jgi:HlyD family secretion protein
MEVAMRSLSQKTVALLGSLFVLAGGSVLWAIRPSYDLRVTTEKTTLGSIVPTVVAVGTLQPTTVVDVGAQVSGTIQFLGADFNSLVRAGEVLARLDPSAIQEQLAAAQAALTEEEATVAGLTTVLADDRVQLTRAQALFADELMPQSDLDDAQVAVNVASAGLNDGEAQVAAARAEVRTNEANLANTLIRSPIDGIVVNRNVDVGQTIAATVQTPVLFTIASDLSHMQLMADIDESDIAELHPGTPAKFTVDAYPGESFSGRVSVIRLQPNAPAGTSVVSYTAVIDVDNPGERLRPGMTATIELAGISHDAVVRLPNNALVFRPSAQVLALAGATGCEAATQGVVWQYDGKRLTPVTVRTGLTDDRWTELLGGPIVPAQPLVTAAAVERRRLEWAHRESQ